MGYCAQGSAEDWERTESFEPVIHHRGPYNRTRIFPGEGNSRRSRVRQAERGEGKEKKNRGKDRDGKKGRKVPCPDGKRRTGIKKALVAIARTLPCHFGDWILMEEFVSIVPSPVTTAPFFTRRRAYQSRYNISITSKRLYEKTQSGIAREIERLSEGGGGGTAISNIQREAHTAAMSVGFWPKVTLIELFSLVERTFRQSSLPVITTYRGSLFCSPHFSPLSRAFVASFNESTAKKIEFLRNLTHVTDAEAKRPHVTSSLRALLYLQ